MSFIGRLFCDSVTVSVASVFVFFFFFFFFFFFLACPPLSVIGSLCL